MFLYELFNKKENKKNIVADEDKHPNERPTGPESPPEMPKGTVKVDVSDVYDWYKLGMHVSDMKGLGHHDFGKGPPQTVFSFGDEDLEHKYLKDLNRLGLKTHDIDPDTHPGTKKEPEFGYKVDEATYTGNLGWMEISRLFMSRPELKPKFLKIKQKHGIEKAFMWAAEQLGVRLQPIISKKQSVAEGSLTESQNFDFDGEKTAIIQFINNVLNNKPNNKEYNPFYGLIVGNPKIGGALKLGLPDTFSATWKKYFQNPAFIGGAPEPWSQLNIGDQFTKATGNDRTLNFYITVDKEKNNIIKFFNNLHKLGSYLQPISQQYQTPIKFKTHSLLDSFVGHNDSLKVYYYDPKVKDLVVDATRKWLSDSSVVTGSRSHEHGVDVKSGGGSFGQILSNHIYDTFTKLIQTNGTKYTPEQYFEWLKKNLPSLIQQVKQKETQQGVAEGLDYEREPLYHATLKAFEPSIMKSGLLPGGNLRMFDWSDSKFVYLSNYPDIARDFIDPGVIEPDEEHEEQIFDLMKQGGVILKIDQNKLNRQLLSADPHFNTDADDGAETYIYSGVIPPSAIIGKEYFSIYESKQGVAEGVPQPGKSSGKPISWISPERVTTEYLTLDEILKSVKGIPYYNNVVDDRDAKNFTWGVTKKVIEYARELIIRPDAYKNWPPIIVVDGKLQDGAHRISTIYLMQKRVQPNNSNWKSAKLKVEFGNSDNVRQDVAENASGYIPSKKQANDPRFKTALTVDVKPDTIRKNAKAFGFKVSRAGIPPLLREDVNLAGLSTGLSNISQPKIRDDDTFKYYAPDEFFTKFPQFNRQEWENALAKYIQQKKERDEYSKTQTATDISGNPTTPEIAKKEQEALLHLLTPEEQALYKKLVTSRDRDKIFQAGRLLKQAWARKVKQDEMKKLLKVHWTKIEQLSSFLNGEISNKTELSAVMYKSKNEIPNKPNWGKMHQTVGLLLDGWVTLAAGQDMSSDNQRIGKGEDKPRSQQKYSLMPDRIDTDINKMRTTKAELGTSWNEALIDNWRVVGLVVTDVLSDESINIIKQTKLPIVDARTKNQNISEGSKAGKITAYHGTRVDIDEFESFSHFGTFRAARDRLDHTSTGSDEDYENQKIYQVKLDIKNPIKLDVDIDKDHELSDYIDLMQRIKLVNNIEAKSINSLAKLAKLLISKGYDGISYKNRTEDPNSISYIIFSPSQATITDIITYDQTSKMKRLKS